MQLLLAEPDPALSREILAACGDLIEMTACRDFPSARAQLVRDPPRILITNLRLADYNGLHLVFLAENEDGLLVIRILHVRQDIDQELG